MNCCLSAIKSTHLVTFFIPVLAINCYFIVEKHFTAFILVAISFFSFLAILVFQDGGIAPLLFKDTLAALLNRYYMYVFRIPKQASCKDPVKAMHRNKQDTIT